MTVHPRAQPLPRARAAHLGPERRRPLILDVAFKLFTERGYKATSMDAIADGADVTKPVIYACFDSKAELFGALLDREEQRVFAQFGAALATGTGTGTGTGGGTGLEDNEAMLTAGFTSMLQAVIDTPETYRIALLGGGDADAVIDARIRRGRNQLIAQITAATRHWLEGRIPERHLDRTAQFVGQTLIGIGDAGLRMMLTSPDRWTPETLGRTLGRFAAAGYSAPGER
jgi:AcrR family transcriptional regulator